MTTTLPDLNEVLRNQHQANEIMLASKLTWVARCHSCDSLGLPEGSNGMPAAHQLRQEGWRVRGRRLLCPGCAQELEDLL